MTSDEQVYEMSPETVAHLDFQLYQWALRQRPLALLMIISALLMLPGAYRSGNVVDFVCGFVMALVATGIYLCLRVYRFIPTPIAYMPLGSLSRYPSGQYVYVIQDIDVTGYYKIGRTHDLVRRLTDFNVKLPFQIGLVLVISTADAVVLETNLHHLFADKRVGGEWFALDNADLINLRGIARKHELGKGHE